MHAFITPTKLKYERFFVDAISNFANKYGW